VCACCWVTSEKRDTHQRAARSPRYVQYGTMVLMH
jgi:hypothetical protein